MKITLTFLRFMLSKPGKSRASTWRVLRRMCMDRVGVKWGRKRKEVSAQAQ